MNSTDSVVVFISDSCMHGHWKKVNLFVTPVIQVLIWMEQSAGLPQLLQDLSYSGNKLKNGKTVNSSASMTRIGFLVSIWVEWCPAFSGFHFPWVYYIWLTDCESTDKSNSLSLYFVYGANNLNPNGGGLPSRYFF